MLWFGKNKKRMEFIEGFVPTSKVQLLRFCFTYHNGDVKKAKEMYDYFSNGIELPDRDPVPPTIFDKIKAGASFLKENQNDLIQGYNLIQSIIKNKGAIPIPESTQAEPLPPINE